MTRAAIVPCLASVLLLGCPPNGDDTGDDTGEPQAEILDPEPPGAPVGVIEGRWTCLGDNEQPAPAGGSVELTGYVRAWSDPDADVGVPVAEVEAFSASGTSLGSGFADPSKDGRVAVTVPVQGEGFTGYVVVTEADHLDWRFQVSRPVTDATFNGWAWLTTPAERDTVAGDLGLALQDGILVGAVHDCDGFGTSNAVLQVAGETDGLYYVEGFDPVDTRTYTSASGRFSVPNVPAGSVVVKAFGRVEEGGPLVLLSSAQTEAIDGAISAVALEPRVGLE